jgi:hypothetical protein
LIILFLLFLAAPLESLLEPYRFSLGRFLFFPVNEELQKCRDEIMEFHMNKIEDRMVKKFG